MKLLIVPSLQQALYLGCDFMKLFKIQLSFLAELLTPPDSSTSTKNALVTKTPPEHHILSREQEMRLQEIIETLPSYEKYGLGRTHLMTHTIDTGDAPAIKQRHYAVSIAVQAERYREIDRMLAMDVIEESWSPWSSPMAIVKKPNGKIRLCLDARKLNKVTKKDAYPLPLVQGLLSRLDKTRCISSLDLKDAFWQIPLESGSREKTAFTIPGRPLYHFKVMPFGLCNAPQTLCRLMQMVIPHHLHDRVFVYLDDLLITTSTVEEHLSLLEDVSSRLISAGLTINVEKSRFLLKEIEYLGHVVGEGGLRPNPDKVRSITEFPIPKNVRQVRRFLGVTGWYRRFIQSYSSIAAPLTELLRKGRRFRWGLEHDIAFESLRDALITAPVLAAPDFRKRFYIQCDASSTGIGAVLYQQDESGEDRPISFMSQKLNAAQRNYSVTEQECLAAVLAIKKFRAYVEGLPFTVITDHASLTWLMSLKDLSGRLARWSLKLQGYDFNIEYRKGSQNAVPDTLSRLTMDALQLSSVPLNIDLKSSAFNSSTYLELIQKLNDNTTKVNLKRDKNLAFINLNSETHSDLSDITSWKLLVPSELTLSLMESAHCPPTGAHLGISKTKEIMQRYFYWPSLNHDIQTILTIVILVSAIKLLITLAIHLLKVFLAQFDHSKRIYIDFLGPYPRTRSGNTSILIAVDNFSKFVLTKPLRKATAREVIQFVEMEIFQMFGVPEVLVTDNGPQFDSRAVASLCEKYGVHHMFTAKYSPQANASERVNRTLLASLRGYIKTDQRRWDENLAAVTHALRNAVHDATGYSPHFLIFGQHAILHGSVYPLLKISHEYAGNHFASEEKPEILYRVYQTVKHRLNEASAKNERNYNLRYRYPALTIGQKIYVKNFAQSSAADKFSAKLAPKYLPAMVTKLVGRVMCEVSDENGKSMGTYQYKDIKL